MTDVFGRCVCVVCVCVRAHIYTHKHLWLELTPVTATVIACVSDVKAVVL